MKKLNQRKVIDLIAIINKLQGRIHLICLYFKQKIAILICPLIGDSFNKKTTKLFQTLKNKNKAMFFKKNFGRSTQKPS